MNCQSCLKELEARFNGQLDEGIRTEVEEHVETCLSCAESYNHLRIAGQVISEEKNQPFNPWLSTRVIAKIRENESSGNPAARVPVFGRLIRPLLATVTLAAAVVAGVMIGSLYKADYSSNELPVELGYMNDAGMESVYLFSDNQAEMP